MLDCEPYNNNILTITHILSTLNRGIIKQNGEKTFTIKSLLKTMAWIHKLN